MDIKFQLNYTKSLSGSKWQHLLNIRFPYAIFEMAANTKLDDTKREEFIRFMTQAYGPENTHWNIRWGNLQEADIRFENVSDAGSFIMLHTVPRVARPPTYRIRGH
jgi:hypothetical protein|tara:strand:+ start:1219 stop:1536 length:318 start_codon:yes stop_codon:yes gene_type:complete